MTNDVKLRALPAQLVEFSGGIIVKRGRATIKIVGERAAEVVVKLLAEAANGADAELLCNAFAAPDREAVRELISKLQTRRILVSDNGSATESLPEDSLDVFYWHFDLRASKVSERLSKQRITIIGVNWISRRLAEALTADGAQNVEVVHYPFLCNLRLLNEQGDIRPEAWPLPAPREFAQWREDVNPEEFDCLVATSDFGGLHLMREWNEYCVRHNRHFLPVVLQDLFGYVGPLVVPGETACFECLRARQNSHLADPTVERSPESLSFEGQAVNGFHPSMASVLGDLAAIELSRFYGGWAPPRVVGTLIEVNLIGPELTARRVLKVPRCQVCSSLHRHTISTPHRNVFMHWNESR
jgi:bacteriocin biosynthesis cyclodehydratase domain-containing protein